MPSVGGSTPSAAACSWNVPSPLFIINWVGPVIEGIAHPRRDEHVLVAVIVKVSRGHTPGPQRLESRRDGGLGEFPLAEIAIQGITEQQRVIILAPHREHFSHGPREARGRLVHGGPQGERNRRGWVCVAT